MSVYLGNTAIGGAKLGSGDVEIYLGSTKIYPTGYTYVITAVNLYYSTGTAIAADGSNYAYALGTVQVKQGSTIIETLTGVALTPSEIGNTTNFSIDGNHIKGNHLHTTPVSTGYTTTTKWVYSTSEAVAGANVTQQTNTRGAYSVVSGRIVRLYPSVLTIGCSATSVTINCETERTLEATWTSGDKSTMTDNLGTVNLSYGGVEIGTLTDSTPYVDNTNITKNWYNTSTKAYYYSGELDDVAAEVKYLTVTQGADSITDTYTETRNYWASMGISGNITAAGGSATLTNPSAGHQYRYRYTWQYGTDYTYSSYAEASDEYVIVTQSASSRVHRTDTSITHDNMDKDTETDTGYYYCRNKSDASAMSSTVSVSATNIENEPTYGDWGEKQYGTPQVTNTDYAVSLSSSRFTSDDTTAMVYLGGTYDILSYSASHLRNTITPWTQTRDKYRSWTSGATQTDTDTRGGTDTESATITDTPTISVQYGSAYCSVSGTSVTFGINSDTSASRFATIRAANNGVYRDIYIYQQKYGVSQVITHALDSSRKVVVTSSYYEAVSISYTIQILIHSVVQSTITGTCTVPANGSSTINVTIPPTSAGGDYTFSCTVSRIYNINEL